MSPAEVKHRELTESRIRDYLRLFHVNPAPIYSWMRFSDDTETNLIDVFVFPLDPEVPVVAAVTNGMSDRRMVDKDDPTKWARRELIQYFPVCTEGHARRLHDMAWVPLYDGFLIDTHHSLAWEWPAVAGTPWKDAFFLEPIVKPHREFRFEVEGDEVSFLWHIPISDAERAYKQQHGSDALIDRMGEIRLPWVFDEANRPPLI